MKSEIKIKLFVNFLLLVFVNVARSNEATTEYWKELGQSELEESINNFKNLKTGRAKNVIMLIGDGMSLATSTAGRIVIGQKNNMKGEEYVTSLDMMPHSGTVKTYSLNYQTPDSASTGTAFLTGVKTRSGMIGVNGQVNGCDDVKANIVNSSMDYAIKAGKSAGIVTTVRVQHATPAAAYAHTSNRRMYSDNRKRLPEKSCTDIGLQLFERRHDLQVVLGGGRSHMRPRNVKDEEFTNRMGERKDSRNLISEWENEFKPLRGRYVWNKTQFDEVDPATTNYLLGLFGPYEMQYSLNRARDRAGEPSLAEMTKKAIEILQKNDNGYFLLIESGLIDMAHHRGRARYALEEFHELDKAVSVAQSLSSPEDTLIVATADHGHMLMFGAGSVRGNEVFGLAPSHKSPARALDGKFYTTLVYGNGPGHAATAKNKEASRQAITSWIVRSRGYLQQSAVPLPLETHSAEDTIVYGSGPWSHLLSGTNEQTHIAHVVMYAACLGPDWENEAHCVPENVLPSCVVKGNKVKLENELYPFQEGKEGYRMSLEEDV